MNMDFGYFRETLLLLLLILLVSCSTGKDSILFVTKTSLGVDIDSKSPTLDIGYTRKEMTLALSLKRAKCCHKWRVFLRMKELQ